MFNRIFVSLWYLRSVREFSKTFPEYNWDYGKILDSEYQLFKNGYGADEIIVANEELEIY